MNVIERNVSSDRCRARNIFPSVFLIFAWKTRVDRRRLAHIHMTNITDKWLNEEPRTETWIMYIPRWIWNESTLSWRFKWRTNY